MRLLRHSRSRAQRARRVAHALRHALRPYKEPIVGVVALTTRDPFQVLIATVLSLRTRDTTTALAARRLFARARTPHALIRLPPGTIERLIYPVGMYPTKARWIRRIARILLDTYGGEVPRTREELLALPGVGRKVANLVLGLCFHIPAICVDTHVHRISNRLGLVRTRTPEETEGALERVLPQEVWVPWNDLLVTWGQNVCTPLRPLCSRCVLRTRHLCPQRGVKNPR